MEERISDATAKEDPKTAEGKSGLGERAQIARPAPHGSALGKTMGILRTILPIAQKVLPLIDGQIGTVVSNLIASQASPREVAKTLLPLEDGLAQLKKQHIELRTHVAGQSAALKQIGEQIEVVRKLTEEATEKQRNLAKGLEKIRRRVNAVALAGLVSLVVLVTLNVVVLVHLRRVLP
jgi:hypothetical protein